MTWLTCEEPGCKARVSKDAGHTRCQRHRPKYVQAPRAAPTDEQKAKRKARDERRRGSMGVMPGWESA